MPCGEIAKLHSLVRSNSAACLSFITARASAACAGRAAAAATLVTLPSTLIAGGKSAVQEQVEPLRETISRSRSLTNFEALVAFHDGSFPYGGRQQRGQPRAVWRSRSDRAPRDRNTAPLPAAHRRRASRVERCAVEHPRRLHG
jgi:hypothetical protein